RNPRPMKSMRPAAAARNRVMIASCRMFGVSGYTTRLESERPATSPAEIGASHALVPQQFARRAGEHDAPMLQHVATIGRLQSDLRHLLDDEERQAFVSERGERCPDLADEPGRQAERRLV